MVFANLFGFLQARIAVWTGMYVVHFPKCPPKNCDENDFYPNNLMEGVPAMLFRTIALKFQSEYHFLSRLCFLILK